MDTYAYDEFRHNATGSSSFITNIEGPADQQYLCRSIFYLFLQNSDCSKNKCKIRIGIQHLPFGELFISQRNSDFDSRYKFTAKELDNELRSNRRTPLKIIIDVRRMPPTNYTS